MNQKQCSLKVKSEVQPLLYVVANRKTQKKETAFYGNLSFALPLGLEPRTP